MVKTIVLKSDRLVHAPALPHISIEQVTYFSKPEFSHL